MTANAPFRLGFKATGLLLAMAAAGVIRHLGWETTRRVLLSALALGVLTVVLGWFAVRRSDLPIVTALFRPERSEIREIIRILSFFTFADPGEVNWNAVEPKRRGSLAVSAILYSLLMLPSALMIDWLFVRGRSSLLLAVLLYAPLWLLIRSLEEDSRG